MSEPRLRDAQGKPLGQPFGEDGSVMYSGADILDAVARPRDWGPWRLDTRAWVLYPVEPVPYRYEVDLERCLTSAEVLDCIIQIAQKNWADNAVIAGLIRALDDVLHPQDTLCSCGQSKRITSARARELATAAEASRKQSIAVYGKSGAS